MRFEYIPANTHIYKNKLYEIETFLFPEIISFVGICHYWATYPKE
jgi:hypothetical protein